MGYGLLASAMSCEGYLYRKGRMGMKKRFFAMDSSLTLTIFKSRSDYEDGKAAEGPMKCGALYDWTVPGALKLKYNVSMHYINAVGFTPQPSYAHRATMVCFFTLVEM